MTRVLLSLAAALCVAWNTASAEDAGKNAQEAPKEPQARKSAPKQQWWLTESAEVRESATKQPWWLKQSAVARQAATGQALAASGSAGGAS